MAESHTINYWVDLAFAHLNRDRWNLPKKITMNAFLKSLSISMREDHDYRMSRGRDTEGERPPSTPILDLSFDPINHRPVRRR
jgi:hypothetical protein